MEMSDALGMPAVEPRQPPVCHISTILARVLYRRGILLDVGEGRLGERLEPVRRRIGTRIGTDVAPSPKGTSCPGGKAKGLPARRARGTDFGSDAGRMKLARGGPARCPSGYSRAVGRAANGPPC